MSRDCGCLTVPMYNSKEIKEPQRCSMLKNCVINTFPLTKNHFHLFSLVAALFVEDKKREDTSADKNHRVEQKRLEKEV